MSVREREESGWCVLERERRVSCVCFREREVYKGDVYDVCV